MPLIDQLLNFTGELVQLWKLIRGSGVIETDLIITTEGLIA